MNSAYISFPEEMARNLERPDFIAPEVIGRNGLGTLVPYSVEELCIDISKMTCLQNMYLTYEDKVMNNRSYSKMQKKLKLKNYRQKIVDLYLYNFVTKRQKNIGGIAHEIKQWKEKHIPPSNLGYREEMVWRYQNLKGWRKFAQSKQGYDYYMKTGQEPWVAN